MWEKIVLNLLSNAFKSTFDGEIRVCVRAQDGMAQLSIGDTGTGIAEEELPQLFQRFRRIDGARRRSHEGSGIGLALVQELVEMHGGSIRVESKLGVGTTFTVSVPFGQAHLSRGQILSERTPGMAPQGSSMAYVQEALGWLPGRDRLKGEVTTDGGGPQSTASATPANGKPTILVVDDNADMREYVQDLLGWRFHVVLAGNGKQALAEAAQHRPDLILTDVMMPEMDGFALLDALRRDPALRGIPVIVLSARAGEEARIEGIGAGADDYLTKPFSARELVARVEAQLKMVRMRKEAMEQETALKVEIQKAKLFAWEALEHIPEVFFTFNREFRFTYMNAAGSALEARLKKTLMGGTLWEMFPELSNTLVEAQLRFAMSQQVSTEFEYYYEPLQTWFQCHAYPLPGEGIILYARDNTEERKTEQALRRSEQLAAAGRLAASIAHEINNPLEAITNLLFLAKLDTGVPENTRALLEMADKELQRLSHITARSLKFYRQRTAPTLSSLDELIESVLFFHETEVKTREIALDRRYRKTPPILCHPGEVQQVLTNLIRNALDALAPQGRLVLAVRPATDRDSRAGVVVTVADSGSGMDQAMLDRLFHPFATTKGDRGTGLGLWVSKGILDKHHARIWVRSQPDRGTVFRFFLPHKASRGK